MLYVHIYIGISVKHIFFFFIRGIYSGGSGGEYRTGGPARPFGRDSAKMRSQQLAEENECTCVCIFIHVCVYLCVRVYMGEGERDDNINVCDKGRKERPVCVYIICICSMCLYIIQAQVNLHVYCSSGDIPSRGCNARENCSVIML